MLPAPESGLLPPLGRESPLPPRRSHGARGRSQAPRIGLPSAERLTRVRRAANDRPPLSARQFVVARQRFQLHNLSPDLHAVSAGYHARFATVASIESTPRSYTRKHLPGHSLISVLHCVHVRSHQRRYIGVLRTIFFAFATLFAKFCLCSKSLSREEALLVVRIGQASCHGEILLEMFVGAES